MNFLKKILSPFVSLKEKETYTALIDPAEWGMVANELKKYKPKTKQERLDDPNSRTFIHAWNDALSREEKFGIPIPDSLIETWMKGETLKEVGLVQIEDDYEKNPYVEDFVDTPEEKFFHREEDTFYEDDNEDVFYEEDNGVQVIRKPAPKKKNKKQKLTNEEKERILWAIVEVGKINIVGEPNIINGVRSSYISYDVRADSMSRANNGSTIAVVEKSCVLHEDKMATVSLSKQGKLLIKLTREEFEPFFTEHHLHKLKKVGDFVLGEVLGKIRILNIFKLVQPMLMVVGGSKSGKSIFFNNMVQSLLYSTPTAEFYLFSGKSDDDGGDFRGFANYPQVKVCSVMSYESNAFEKILDDLTMVLTEQMEKLESKEKPPKQFIFIDEFAFLLELDNDIKRPKPLKDNSESWEVESYDLDMYLYMIEMKKKKILSLIANYSRLGRKIGVIAIGSQVMTKEILSNQAWGNFSFISFRTSGSGRFSGFNKLSEVLLPHGDGLIIDPKTNEPMGFQSPMATP